MDSADDTDLTTILNSIFVLSRGKELYIPLRNLDVGVLRSGQYKRAPNPTFSVSGTNEQGKRASIRQVTLDMKIKMEMATKAEIEVLKDVGIIGKRAPCAGLLSLSDSILFLSAFGYAHVAVAIRLLLQGVSFSNFISNPHCAYVETSFNTIFNNYTLTLQQHKLLLSTLCDGQLDHNTPVWSLPDTISTKRGVHALSTGMTISPHQQQHISPLVQPTIKQPVGTTLTSANAFILEMILSALRHHLVSPHTKLRLNPSRALDDPDLLHDEQPQQHQVQQQQTQMQSSRSSKNNDSSSDGNTTTTNNNTSEPFIFPSPDQLGIDLTTLSPKITHRQRSSSNHQDSVNCALSCCSEIPVQAPGFLNILCDQLFSSLNTSSYNHGQPTNLPLNSLFEGAAYSHLFSSIFPYNSASAHPHRHDNTLEPLNTIVSKDPLNPPQTLYTPLSYDPSLSNVPYLSQSSPYGPRGIPPTCTSHPHPTSHQHTPEDDTTSDNSKLDNVNIDTQHHIGHNHALLSSDVSTSDNDSTSVATCYDIPTSNTITTTATTATATTESSTSSSQQTATSSSLTPTTTNLPVCTIPITFTDIVRSVATNAYCHSYNDISIDLSQWALPSASSSSSSSSSSSPSAGWTPDSLDAHLRNPNNASSPLVSPPDEVRTLLSSLQNDMQAWISHNMMASTTSPSPVPLPEPCCPHSNTSTIGGTTDTCTSSSSLSSSLLSTPHCLACLNQSESIVSTLNSIIRKYYALYSWITFELQYQLFTQFILYSYHYRDFLPQNNPHCPLYKYLSSHYDLLSHDDKDKLVYIPHHLLEQSSSSSSDATELIENISTDNTTTVMAPASSSSSFNTSALSLTIRFIKPIAVKVYHYFPLPTRKLLKNNNNNSTTTAPNTNNLPSHSEQHDNTLYDRNNNNNMGQYGYEQQSSKGSLKTGPNKRNASTASLMYTSQHNNDEYHNGSTAFIPLDPTEEELDTYTARRQRSMRRTTNTPAADATVRLSTTATTSSASSRPTATKQPRNTKRGSTTTAPASSSATSSSSSSLASHRTHQHNNTQSIYVQPNQIGYMPQLMPSSQQQQQHMSYPPQHQHHHVSGHHHHHHHDAAQDMYINEQQQQYSSNYSHHHHQQHDIYQQSGPQYTSSNLILQQQQQQPQQLQQHQQQQHYHPQQQYSTNTSMLPQQSLHPMGSLPRGSSFVPPPVISLPNGGPSTATHALMPPPQSSAVMPSYTVTQQQQEQQQQHLTQAQYHRQLAHLHSLAAQGHITQSQLVSYSATLQQQVQAQPQSQPQVIQSQHTTYANAPQQPAIVQQQPQPQQQPQQPQQQQQQTQASPDSLPPPTWSSHLLSFASNVVKPSVPSSLYPSFLGNLGSSTTQQSSTSPNDTTAMAHSWTPPNDMAPQQPQQQQQSTSIFSNALTALTGSFTSASTTLGLSTTPQQQTHALPFWAGLIGRSGQSEQTSTAQNHGALDTKKTSTTTDSTLPPQHPATRLQHATQGGGLLASYFTKPL